MSYANIFEQCKQKGHTNAKADEITKTVITYLDYSAYETSSLMCCDERTVFRRIKEFLKED